MAVLKTFERKLNDLWTRRTRTLRAAVGLKAQGREKSWSPSIRQKGINELIDLTSQVLLGPAKKEVRRIVRRRLLRKLSGRGAEKKFERMIGWARTIRGPIIYTFWRGKTCLYVGKSAKWSRLMNYSNSLYMRDADAIRVFQIKNRSQLPKAECLLIHLLKPRKNKQKAARVKWGKACPICKTHDLLRDQLKVIFR